MPSMAEKIEQILKQKLQAKTVEVEDQSSLHKGHAGAMKGGGHYRVRVISPLFEGKSLVEQHQLVYQALQQEMKSDIHALALQTSPK